MNQQQNSEKTAVKRNQSSICNNQPQGQHHQLLLQIQKKPE
jgi:hypothetical protein